ncbi:DUF4290 domain-containing protein [Salibacteraceae bacterium]|jgi:hypothetical protein|nr:DUF4290 domain-containing protein [Salibacteraceae bacterium]MDC1304727.1 DUF4290 domain-containing protein [Salibacteraceae bacterium]
MEYNTQRKPLALGEYGRYVQEMVEHTMAIEDREERNKAAQAIIQLMTVMNPSYKGNDELINKLWDDLYVMSNFQLDVDAPYPKPEPAVNIQAEKIEYPKGDFKYRHYGKSIENLIEVAKSIEDKDEQQALTQLIAHLMKRSYLNYNRDSVNEEMIIDQLKEMSGGLLKLNDNFRFQHTNDILGSQPRNSSKSSSKSRSKRKWKK